MWCMYQRVLLNGIYCDNIIYNSIGLIYPILPGPIRLAARRAAEMWIYADRTDTYLFLSQLRWFDLTSEKYTDTSAWYKLFNNILSPKNRLAVCWLWLKLRLLIKQWHYDRPVSLHGNWDKLAWEWRDIVIHINSTLYL